MTPKLTSDIEQFVAAAPTGAVRIQGAGGTYWLVTEEAMQVKKLVEEGLAESEAGLSQPWSAEEIIAEGKRRLAARQSN